jgi:hypothetical protein
MPYIKQETREELDEHINNLNNRMLCYTEKEITGIVNYVFTKILLRQFGDIQRYWAYNEAIGVLECCKQEFYRHNIAPYEDTKIENDFYGDVR